jgi:hypothetical protein
MLSVYDEHAPKLKELGYHPLPIGPGTKKPQHFVPGLNEFQDTPNWTHPARPVETSPQPGAGVGVRLGKQADGTYLVGIDWDFPDAARSAREAFPNNLIMKVGRRGFTAFFRSNNPVRSKDFRIRGHCAVQVLSEGRQTVLPPTVHPDTGHPYTWSGCGTVYDVPIGEIPDLPDDYIKRIEGILYPFGFEPDIEIKVNGHDTSADRPADESNDFRELNDAALRDMTKWVPDLGLAKCRRRPGRTASYEAVASFRESSTGRPTEQRNLNLKISGKHGIKDFGTGIGYSPITLVMAANCCSKGDAVAWLQERLNGKGPEIDIEAITQPKEEPKTEQTKADERPPRKVRFKLINFDDLRPSEGEQPYVVEELIPCQGMTVMWGPPKCFKSFLILDIAFHIASGREYRGRYVKQGTVIYCAFEGGYELNKRIHALRLEYDLPDSSGTPFEAMLGNANLIADHKQMIADFKYVLGDRVPAIVVLDTLNKSLFGSESKDTDMANYIRAAEAIIEAFKCAVVVIHHCGWDDSRLRGHSSLQGALVAELQVKREKGSMVAGISVDHMREGPEGVEIVSRLDVVEVAKDFRGRARTTLIPRPHDGDMTMAEARQWPRTLTVFRNALTEAVLASGVEYKIPDGPRVKAAALGDIRDAFYRTYIADHEPGITAEQRQDSKKKAFQRAIAKAQALSLIGAVSFPDGRQLLWLAIEL